MALAGLAILAGSNGRPLGITAAAAQPVVPVAQFVANIRPDTQNVLSSSPRDMAVFQDALYFSADDGVNGRELWRLGTTGLPTLVKDINPGPSSSSPVYLTVAGDTLYFLATTANEGQELWRYDGTGQPTIVADLYPGTGSGVPFSSSGVTAFGTEVVFQGRTASSGDELFAFDGTTLKEFDIYPDEPFCAPGCSSDPYGLTVYDGVLYFGAGDRDGGVELFQYNGTSVQRLTNIVPGSGHAFPDGFTGIGNRLVFSAYNAAGWNQLFSYDIGTATLTELATGTTFGGAFPEHFTSHGTRAYFSAADPTTGRELWMTDGTQAGTALVDNLNPGAASSNPNTYAVLNGEVYFAAADPVFGNEIRATDGSTIRLLKDINPDAANTSWESPTVLGTFLIFTPNGSQLLSHPWFTTGTESGTDVVRQADGSLIYTLGAVDDSAYTFFNGALYFAAFDTVRGDELWRITLGAATPTTTTLTSSLNPSIVGDPVTFTATVSGTNPTGTVTFFDGLTPLDTVALTGATASFSTSILGAGNHTITATYNGDAANAPSTSIDLNQVVNKIQTTTTLISSLNPSVFTETVTFTATVAPVSGSGTPTGDVTFFDGPNGLATVALIGNTATFQISTLSGGAHAITASYAGSVNHEASASNAVQQTVTKLPTTTTLFSSPEPSTTGETVTFSAAVAGWFPTGEVTFSEGGVTLATAPVIASAAGNIATFQTSTLTSGVHTITATYAGDLNHSGSAAGDNHTVNDPFPPTAPVANDQNVTMFEDGTLPLLLTASDVNNDPLTYFIVGKPTRGSLTGTPPNVVYTPNPNFAGQDSFTFQANDKTFDSNVGIVTIIITEVNDAPVAGNDTYTTSEDTPLIAVPGVLGNDSDVDSPTLTASVVTSTVHGVLTLNANGSFTYAPQANFFGADSFTYRVSDGQLTSNIATVSITITPVNDPPIAINDSYTTTEGIALTIAAPAVLANDTDVDSSPLTAVLATGPANGTLTLNANGSFTYTPAASFTGPDSFTYRANDGPATSAAATVTINVIPRNFTWTATGNLGTRRRYHTATLLPNGRVLVTGGYGQGNSALSSAELYDPFTGTWTATGSMSEKRASHTATLLENGLVLVAGGGSTQTETYDPSTGTWTNAGRLNTFHGGHTATRLLNGNVLVAGGVSRRDAELFDPSTRTWTMTGSLSVARHFHTATLLLDGRVLAVGGYGITGGTNSVEIYDPAAGTWSPAANLATNRTGHSASVLANGNVLIVGGGNNSSPVLATTELFDPTNGTWTNGSSLATARVSHTATVLQSGRVLVAGGGDAGAGPLVSSEVFDPTTGQWSSTASLISGRVFHTATLLTDGRVLAVGGFGNVALESAEAYGPSAPPSVAKWETAGTLGARSNHTATLMVNGDVLVAAGIGSNFQPTNTADMYNAATGTWSAIAPLTTARRSHTATRLPNGKVLVVGGDGQMGVVFASAELYDPATDTWAATGSMAVPRSGHTATLLSNGLILVVSGLTSELYNPATGIWSASGSLSASRSGHTATLLSNGRVLVAGGFASFDKASDLVEIYDPDTGTWSAAAKMLTARRDHSAVGLPNGTVLVAGGNTTNLALKSAETFDSGTSKWKGTADLIDRRLRFPLLTLSDGRPLAAGGLGTTGILNQAEVYNPTLGKWTGTSSLNTARTGHTLTLLTNGKVLAVGGIAVGSVVLNSAEIYTP